MPPDFAGALRYEALRGTPRWLAVYDTQSVDVLSSAAYRARLEQPTEWTRRVMPGFRDTVRAVCRVLGEAGAGTGGVMRTLPLEPLPGAREQLRAALAGPLAGQLLERPGIARVRAVEAEPAGSEAQPPVPGAAPAEGALRGPDRSISFALLIEGTHEAALHKACEAVLPSATLAQMGAVTPAPWGDYRLLYMLSH